MFALILSRVVSSLVSLITLAVTTRWFSPSEYGELALFMAFISFFGLFLVNPVGQWVNRQTHEWYIDGQILLQMGRYLRYLCIVAILAAIVFLIWWNPDVQAPAYVAALILGGMCFFYAWYGTLPPMLNMLGMHRQSALLSAGGVVTGLLFSTLCIYLFHSAIAWIFGQLLGYMLVTLISWKLLGQINKSSPGYQKGVIKPFLTKKVIWNYCVPLGMATLMMWILNNGYRFWMVEQWGKAQLGVFVLGATVALQFWGIVETLTNQILYPRFYAGMQRGIAEESLQALINIAIPVYILMLGVGLATSQYLLVLLADPRFGSAGQFCQFMMLSEMCRASCNVFMQFAQIEKKQHAMIKPYLVGVCILLLAAFVPNGQLTIHYFVTWLPVVSMSTLIVAILLSKRVAKLNLRTWLLYGVILITLGMFLSSVWMRTASQLLNLLLLLGYTAIGMLALFTLVRRSKDYRYLMSIRLPAESALEGE